MVIDQRPVKEPDPLIPVILKRQDQQEPPSPMVTGVRFSGLDRGQSIVVVDAASKDPLGIQILA